jgi:ribosome-associated toxin RatA of RatAB toxin-antitoxin module
MAYIEETREIAATPEAVYAVICDVERWPEWTQSMERLERLDDGPLRLQSRARVKPVGSREAVWTVTRLVEGRGFDWETRPMPGLRVVARHWIEAADGGCRVTLSLRSSGPLAWPTARIVAGETSGRNVRLEADGLKRRCET